jgi:hypothetical protein
MDHGDLERLLAFEIGQDANQPRGQHRLAGARRSDEQKVMPAGGGHLQGQAGDRLAVDIGQIG